MESLIEEKKDLKRELLKYQKIILEIENQIMNIEREIADFSEIEILDTLVLSDQQRAIVESDKKNILVVACPGSGKTHTVISRYVHLVVHKKVDPSKIILITFTKKAGQEMYERINNILPNKPPYYVGTLHGFAYRMLQKYNKINYTVLNEKEPDKLLKSCLKNVLENNEIKDDINTKLLEKQITSIYEKITTDYPLNIEKTLNYMNINIKYKIIINKILKEYRKIKKQQNLLDFNDLMIMFCNLLNTKKAEKCIDSFEYIFFDEYQDINPVQNYILSKFNNNTNIMVVGDDAQAIYAFRGSKVEYIWDFKDNFKCVNPDDLGMYFLETNYRSTPSIINFFQDIISHNTKQYKKDVKSIQTQSGLKPYIMCFSNLVDQYKWVVKDIYEKHKNGIPLKNMVILSRKNRSFKDIECELLKYNIPVTKSIGISLLNKLHVKDFMAFLTVIANKKSLFHWKRILGLHKNIGIVKANHVIEYSQNNNLSVIESLDSLVTNDEYYKKHLGNFNKALKDIGKERSLILKLHIALDYLSHIWKINRVKNIKDKVEDITQLLSYLNNSTIEDYINNIYLNCEISTDIEDSLYLSSVHGSKGLEWEYVYVIDMNNKDFPSIRQNYFKYEMDNCEEERRLFYVASSRAKKYLTITYHQDLHPKNTIMLSPFIRELNKKNYLGSNIFIPKLDHTNKISVDINNYIRAKGYKKLSELINKLPHTRTNINTYCKCDLPLPLNIKQYYIIGNFMDYLIAKMLLTNFPKKVKNFDLNLMHYSLQFPENIYYQYKDKLIDWRDMLSEIYYIATYNKNIYFDYKEYLLSDDAIKYYIQLEKSLRKFINSINPKVIQCHMNVSYGNIRGELDLLLDDHIIEIKSTQNEACTFSSICQALMYGYLLKKKDMSFKKISIYNSINGTLDTFDVTKFNSIKYKKILYK